MPSISTSWVNYEVITLLWVFFLTLESPTSQNVQTHPNAVADELFECVSPLCWVGSQRAKFQRFSE